MRSAEETAAPQEIAIADLDEFDGPAFTRARAALEYQFPNQARYVFAGLVARRDYLIRLGPTERRKPESVVPVTEERTDRPTDDDADDDA